MAICYFSAIGVSLLRAVGSVTDSPGYLAIVVLFWKNPLSSSPFVLIVDESSSTFRVCVFV